MTHVRIFNPESQMIDSTVLRVEKFTVQSVFEAMEARNWRIQEGVYVALRVAGPGSMALRGHSGSVLTFTVRTSERVVRETIAVPA